MNLDALLRDQNPQWFDVSYRPAETAWFQRPYYEEVLSWLEKDLIISLTGLRRVGKSTLLKQALGHLLHTGISPHNLFYFSFDRSVVKNESDTLRQILEAYAVQSLRRPLSSVDSATYIFLDEIQIIPYWQDVIKTYYDTARNVRFILSGSSSLFIRKKSMESLAGRIKEIEIPPLSFHEFLQLNQETRTQIYQGGLTGDADTKLDKFSTAFLRDVFTAYFREYLEVGQFPQPVTQAYTQDQTKDYLQTIQEKIVEVDLPQTFPIQRPDILKILFRYLQEHSGSLLLYDSLANDLGIDTRTVRTYVDWLQRAFLIDMCHNQTKKIAKASRTAKKIYLTTTNFSYNAPLGSMVETYVFSFLKRLPVTVEFFRFQDREVDFITTTKKGMKIPWEVKYTDSISAQDEKELIRFATRHQATYAFLITKFSNKQTKVGDLVIHHVPAARLELTKRAILKKL